MPDSDRDFPAGDDQDCPPNALKDYGGRIDLPILPNLDFAPDPNLTKQGWQRRYMADPNQVKEAAQLYTELGFEVHTETIQPSELSEICGSCRLATCRAYVTIYTRKPPS